MLTTWDVAFLNSNDSAADRPHALVILNQPFALALLQQLWKTTQWHCCADGGANRLHDVFLDSPALADADEARLRYLPDLIKGDLDSLRPDVRAFYTLHGVEVVQDNDQDSTDLMKCVRALSEKEKRECRRQYDIILLGGLAGRLDHTIHTLAYLHKLRKTRERVFAVTNDNVGWVLDSGEHEIIVDHDTLGPTCGLLPVGIDSTILSTKGLRWNLESCESSFDGMVSTSNHLVPRENIWISTSKPIWWTAELRTVSVFARGAMLSPTITVLYFASAATATGLAVETVPISESGQNLAGLAQLLISRHPRASRLRDILDISQWSVNAEMVEEPDKMVLKGGEEVAVICPVSGG